MIDINQELHQNFIDFSYEANSQRAFPDARDGLKPGQRACLWEMFDKGYVSTKPHVKSAKISGGVISNFHPHGDAAIYDTFARMSQPWINNIPEVDWHGANGSIQISGEPAASRYTEARLAKASEKGFFSNIKKNTVKMIPNFSEDLEWPEVFPAIFPRLFVNGSQGIGVTIANSWPLNNLEDFQKAVKEYHETGEINYDNIYPDFPSGGIIINKDEIPAIYKTGRGKVLLRGHTTIKGKVIQIHDLPYQVYVEPFIDKIKELVTSNQILGIRDVYNKSDKKQILIEIECDGEPQIVLNNLLLYTDLQKSYSVNQYALVNKVPKLLNLKDYIDIYLNHNLTCLRREYEFDMKKADERLEIVDGLINAIAYIDDIIEVIKTADNKDDACKKLMSKYGFTERQVKAIIDMRIGRLVKLEGVALAQEREELRETIKTCAQFLANEESQYNELFKRLDEFVKEFKWARRTEIANLDTPGRPKAGKKEKIPEKCNVVISENTYIKTVAATGYRKLPNEVMYPATTDERVLIFTEAGLVHKLPVSAIPAANGKGQFIKVLADSATPVGVYKESDEKYLLFVTKNGLARRVGIDKYVDVNRKAGVKAQKLKDGDVLKFVAPIDYQDFVIVTHFGTIIRLNGADIPIAAGRETTGAKAITLRDGDYVVGCTVINKQRDIKLITESRKTISVLLENLVTVGRGAKGKKSSNDEMVVAIK